MTKTWRLALAGMVCLAVAMGIGRFAFTPLLPMMMADGVVDLAGASWLASANYLGYLVGALACTFQPWISARLGRAGVVNGPVWARRGLVATVLLTLAMALHTPALWPGLRFAAGVASAVVFVHGSGWCMSRLAQLGEARTGAFIFTGPGIGIVLSGLAASAMLALGVSAALGWSLFGVLAAVLTAVIWRIVDPRDTDTVAAAPATAAPAEPHGRVEVGLLAVAYGLAGFGYIITATFLPVIAREALPGAAGLDLFWPLFGVGVVAGALIASRVSYAGDLRLMLAGCYVVQAAGVVAGLWSPSLAGFALGSLLLGLPFTAITFYALQEVRRIKPLQVSSYVGLLTAMYGIGQIAGPPLAAALVKRSGNAGGGFTVSLLVAAGALVLGSVLYVLLAKWHPARPAPSR